MAKKSEDNLLTAEGGLTDNNSEPLTCIICKESNALALFNHMMRGGLDHSRNYPHDCLGACLGTQLKGHGLRTGRVEGPLHLAPGRAPRVCQAPDRSWMTYQVFVQYWHIRLLQS